MLGEKGVGRFAADKLARRLEIVSRCPRRADEVQAVVDWDHFDNDALLLSEVQNRWEVRPAPRDRSRTAPLLRMTGLRTAWTERMFRRLCIRLVAPALAVPADTTRSRSASSPTSSPQYSGELRADFLEQGPVPDRGRVRRRSRPSPSPSTAARPSASGGTARASSPAARSASGCTPSTSRRRPSPGSARGWRSRAWLREWTGVSIYRDGFRVWPYGEPHDDWLRLDQRRVNNPVEHLSNNQVIGFIDIGRDRNPELMDQTNREGLIHNQAFEDLRRLVYFVLQAVEAERQSIRHPARRATGGVVSRRRRTSRSPDELERLATRAGGEVGRELRELRRRLDEQTAREEADSGS